MNKNPAKLILENGTIFNGFSLGSIGESLGEVCFNTGMTGYQEILTDPSYCQQLITMTYPHIGNYGVNSEDIESSKIQASGFVIKEESIVPSNWRSQISIGDYLQNENIVGIKNIDTRSLTIHLRNHGAMNGIISSIEKDVNILKRKLELVPSMNGQDLVKEVTCNEPYTWTNKTEGSFRVAAIDYGIKHNILRLLTERDCIIDVFPANRSPEEIM